MHSKSVKTGFWCLAFLAASAARADFQVLPLPPLVAGEELPAGWSGHQPEHLERIGGAHRVVKVEGQPVLQLTKSRFESVLMVHTEVEIPPGQSLLEFGIRTRVPEIDLPRESPGRNRFRAGAVFLDKDGEEIPGSYPQLAFGEELAEWTLALQEYPVPEDARRVRVSLQMLNCVGVWEFAGIGLRVRP